MSRVNPRPTRLPNMLRLGFAGSGQEAGDPQGYRIMSRLPCAKAVRVKSREITSGRSRLGGDMRRPFAEGIRGWRDLSTRSSGKEGNRLVRLRSRGAAWR
jgi:hypothetical protein